MGAWPPKGLFRQGARPFSVGRGFPDAPCTASVRGARRPGAPSPLCRGGQWPPGAGKVPPCRGRSPSGGKDHFFFCGKRNGPSLQRKRRGPVYAGLMDENGGQRLSYDFGDPFRPLRPALVEQGQVGASNPPPPAGASLRAELVGCFPCGKGGDLRRVRLPHSAARVARPGGGRIELQALPCSPMAWP